MEAHLLAFWHALVRVMTVISRVVGGLMVLLMFWNVAVDEYTGRLRLWGYSLRGALLCGGLAAGAGLLHLWNIAIAIGIASAVCLLATLVLIFVPSPRNPLSVKPAYDPPQEGVWPPPPQVPKTEERP